jgi:hypothetical protein
MLASICLMVALQCVSVPPVDLHVEQYIIRTHELYVLDRPESSTAPMTQEFPETNSQHGATTSVWATARRLDYRI